MNTIATRVIRAIAVCTLTTAGVVPISADAAPAVSVDIAKFSFGPKDLTVAPGTTVRWINHDETPHTVASLGDKKLMSSKAMDTDDKFEFTFPTEGDFAYVCTVHPFMTGVVHVRKP